MKILVLVLGFIVFGSSSLARAEVIPDGPKKDAIFSSLYEDIAMRAWHCAQNVELSRDSSNYLRLTFSFSETDGKNFFLPLEKRAASILQVLPGSQPVMIIENYFTGRDLASVYPNSASAGDTVATLRVETTPDYKRVTALTLVHETYVLKNVGTLIDPKRELVLERLDPRIMECKRQ